MSLAIGIGGARRNLGAALAIDGRLVAACQEERLTRVRGMGSVDGRIPSDAVKAVLGLAGLSGSDVSTYVTGEEGLLLPSDVHAVLVDHHEAHAVSAFYTSGLKDVDGFGVRSAFRTGAQRFGRLARAA